MNDTSFSLFKSFSQELDPKVLQRKFLLSLLDLQNVSRGSIWIRDNNHYLCIDAVGLESDRILGVKVSTETPSIVGWVIENGKMTIADPSSDQRHYHELEENLAVKSSLILCFPLVLRDGTVYGAVQVIDTSPEKDRINLDKAYLTHIQDLVNIGAISLSNAIYYNDQLKETEALRRTLDQIRSQGVILGQSPAFLRVMELVRSYAVTDYPVLITGESGTGKELVAMRLHELSRRRDRPFVVQNCSAIPESLLESELFGHRKGSFSGAIEDKKGLFEAADGGTVFLDEIGDMPMGLQARILRVIQNSEIKPVGQTQVKRVDIRVISATNKNIQQAVAQGTFRQDLFYRLSVLPIHLPPLRDRKTDIPLLFRHFMRREAVNLGLPDKQVDHEAMRRLIQYPWAGNIRELENLARYLLVISEGAIIRPEDLPFFYNEYEVGPGAIPGPPESALPMAPAPEPAAPESIDFGPMSWEDAERAYAHYVLRKNGWNVSKAAQDSGINRSTFASRLRRLGIRRR